MMFKISLVLAVIAQPAETKTRCDKPNNGNGGNGNGKIPLKSVRSYDGSEDPRAANDAFLIRRGTPSYPDGFGFDLMMVFEPNAREVSNIVGDATTLTSPPSVSNRVTDMLSQWGQFIDHDISVSPQGPAGFEEFPITSPDCNLDVVCNIPFRRSIHGFPDGGTRQQINKISGFLDASMVYGNTLERANALRAFEGGRLKMTEDGLLPLNEEGLPNDLPGGFGDGSNLFFAGDTRANEQTGLIAMHTLLVREHNRLASILESEFKKATDEEIYQMARKLVAAELNVITYNEYLPATIGSYAPSLDDYEGYDSSVNPGIANEFSTVAFRFGHSMLTETLLLHDGTGIQGNLGLVEAFFNPDLVHDSPNLIDEVLIGATIQPATPADTKIMPEVRDMLFGSRTSGNALDLASLNIQRGRDHGVSSYNGMRVAYDLPTKSSFSEVTSNPEVAAELESAYGDIVKCDAWVCGLAEDHVEGGEVGELFATVIADQFLRLMAGDEHFYLNDRDVCHPQITRLIDVEAITLHHMINMNTVGGAQPKAFLLED